MASAPWLESMATLACVLLALAVGLRHERSAVAGTMLALLLALAAWNGGLALAAIAEPGPWRAAALRSAVLGMFAAVGLWFLLALRHRWPRRLRGPTVVAVALAPVAVFFVGAVTNASHGWIVLPDARWDPGLVGWAAPLTYLLAALVFAYGLVGTAIFAFAGVRLFRRDERRSGVVLTLTMLGLPIVSMNAGGGDVGMMLIGAASITIATLVLALTALRYQLLEPPPLGHREVIDHLRHGVLMANASGEVLDHNEAAERLLGFAPRGSSIADAVAAIASPDRRESVRRSLAMGGVDRPVALQLDALGERHLEVAARPILGERGVVLGRIATLRDRTEERRFGVSALRTQKLETLGTLAAGIAHEVNNPLAFVRANLGEIARLGEIVERRLASGGSKLAHTLCETGELARDALDGLERIQRAVSDVRRLAAAPNDGEAYVSIEQVVGDAVRLARRRARDRIEIEARFASDLPPVLGSEQLLVQAVLSLLIDAQHAVEGAGEPRIEVETGADDEGVWVRVRENGPGLSAPLLHPRSASALADAPDAYRFGLGLSVASGIAQDHGGSLCTESGPSGGTYLLRLAAPMER